MQSDFLQQFVSNYLPARRRAASKGWISFNAPCCVHNGETADTRSRGGVIMNPDGGISYHCFNCNYKTSYIPGRPLSYKFRKLLSWLGAAENSIRQMVIEAIRLKEFIEITEPQKAVEAPEVNFPARPLPRQAQSFKSFVTFLELNNGTNEMPKQFHDAVEYVFRRKIDMQRYDFYWTPEVEHKLNYRVVVPFIWQGQTIGYTARSTVDGIKPKYHNSHEPNFVFNTNEQRPENKFVLVVEGPFDAMAIDGVAVLSNDCNEEQADIIDNLGKEVIVVPDFDVHINKLGKKVWPGGHLIDRAVEYGWSVAFPVWMETCKDVGEAVERYGKLFVLKSILDSVEHNKFKIEILKRKTFNGK